jgi:uncharacterized protein YodC (DUF2158 family)
MSETKSIVPPQGGSGTAKSAAGPVAFDRGAVVALKSGSPKMTVEKLKGESFMHPNNCVSLPVREGEVACVWFDTDGTLQRDRFATDCLALAAPDKDPS